MNERPAVRFTIRPYEEHDREPVLALASRLTIGIAPWRSAHGMLAAAQEWIVASLDGIGVERAVYVAETTGMAIVGFASVSRQIEFTGEAQAYLGELAVAADAEGAGVARELLAAVENWARGQHLGLVVLETGTRNNRARRFYERAGFLEESVKLTKVLDERELP